MKVSNRRLVDVPAPLREFVIERIEVLGPADAAKELGCSRHTAVTVAAGLGVMRATLALLNEAFLAAKAA
ncbi:MAG: hypothetical protein QM756_26610 [Polyangiaceae bacterium]